MKLPVFALVATIGLALPAMAQTPGPDAPPPGAPPAATAAPDAGAPDAGAPAQGQNKMKQLREACREQIKGQGLKGEDRMKAVSACVVKERPDLAQREGCRIDGWEKGLRKDDLRAFVKDCVKGKA